MALRAPESLSNTSINSIVQESWEFGGLYSHELQLQSLALCLGPHAQPSATSPASPEEDTYVHSPYLLRDLVKVEELEMLYAEFCLGTRATEEPSVTCGQKWAEQAATPETHRGNSPSMGRNQPQKDAVTRPPPQGHHLQERSLKYLCDCWEGAEQEHTRKLSMKIAE